MPSDRVTEGKQPQTRRIRYAHLSAFFNFIRNNLDPDFRNPCDTPAMKRLFRNRAPGRWNTIDKDTVDKVIFKTVKTRNRLMLELMARGGMRIGEVLKLTPSDINERIFPICYEAARAIVKKAEAPRRHSCIQIRSSRRQGHPPLSSKSRQLGL
jgi:integrase